MALRYTTTIPSTGGDSGDSVGSGGSTMQSLADYISLVLAAPFPKALNSNSAHRISFPNQQAKELYVDDGVRNPCLTKTYLQRE